MQAPSAPGKLKTLLAYTGATTTVLVMVPSQSTVAQFIELVQSRVKRADLSHVWRNGVKIFPSKNFAEFYQPDQLFFLTVTDSAPTPAEISAILATRTGVAVPAASAPPPSPGGPGRPGTAAYSPVLRDFAPPPEPAPGNVRLFTTLTLDSMLYGHEVTVPGTADPARAVRALAPILAQIGGLPEDAAVLLFFSCGIAFTSGTIDGFFESGAFPGVKRRLYAVVTRRIDASALNAEYSQLCDATAGRAALLSPVVAATEVGYTHIAALLGYLGKSRNSRALLPRALARLTGFAPLITSLSLICSAGAVRGVGGALKLLLKPITLRRLV
jgi:hypothetical protein